MDYKKDNYSIDEIYNLIQNEVEENIHLDYKEARALGKDDAKKAEITKDVSAFANSDGGVIVYGVAEENYKPQEITPIDGKIFTKEWLENIIQLINQELMALRFSQFELMATSRSPYMLCRFHGVQMRHTWQGTIATISA